MKASGNIPISKDGVNLHCVALMTQYELPALEEKPLGHWSHSDAEIPPVVGLKVLAGHC